MVNLRIKWLPY